MGTWGKGNFDSDDAREFLDSEIERLGKLIEEFLSSEKLKVDSYLEQWGESILMPAVDMMLTLCRHYESSPRVEEATIIRWKESYLKVYDETADDYRSPQSKIDRRNVITDTFRQLEDIAMKRA